MQEPGSKVDQSKAPRLQPGARPQTARQFARYLAVGVWNTIFGYAVFAGFTALLTPHIPYAYVISSLLASFISITMAFLMYKHFVFQTKGNYLREWARCIVVYSGATLLQAAFLPPLVGLLRRTTPWHTGAPYIAGAIVIGLATLFSFVGHKRFSFASSGPTN